MMPRMRLGWIVVMVGVVGCFNPDDPPAEDGTSSDGSTTAVSMTDPSATATNPTASSTLSSSSGPTATAADSSTTLAATTDTGSGSASADASTTAAPIAECGNGEIEAGQVCFAATVTLMVGPSPRGVATERINADAFDDFAVSMSSGRLLTFLGDGTGTFTQTITEDPDPLGWGRVALGAIADGNVDAIVGEPGNINVIRFRGFGDGSYSAGTNIGAGGGRMHMLDLDGDDILELLVGVEFGAAVYRGAADETFTFVDTYGGDGPPDGFALADFDGDMELDLVVTGSTNTVAVRRGNGDATFGPASMLTIVGNGRELVTGDFDGDGNSDFAASSSAMLGVHFGNGDGTFAPPVEVATAAAIGALAAADLDGDGADDLLCATTASAMEVFLGADDQILADSISIPTSVSAGAMDVADFNDDGAVDVVITNDGDLNVAIMLSNP